MSPNTLFPKKGSSLQLPFHHAYFITSSTMLHISDFHYNPVQTLPQSDISAQSQIDRPPTYLRSIPSMTIELLL